MGTDEDFFNIVTFSTDVEHWNKEEAQEEIFSDNGFVENITTEFYRATDENKNIAIGSILDLQADGGTNINDALLAALAIGKDAKQKGAFPADVQTMVVFLTDGNSTNGVTYKPTIKSNIKSTNTRAEFPIYTIAFCADADFQLMKDIATENEGAAKRIYEGSDAALQLENFYAEISSPLLSNLRLQYVGGLVDTASLSETEAKTLFRGREIIVAGKLSNDANTDADRLSIQIDAGGKGGEYHRDFDICLREPVAQGVSGSENSAKVVFTVDRQQAEELIDDKLPLPSPLPACLKPREYPKSEAQNFLKNLHAFLNIKQLLKKSKLTSNETEKSALEIEATKLALETNLVTEVTSLVVTRPDEEPVINKLVTRLFAEGEIVSPAFSASGGIRGGGSNRNHYFSRRPTFSNIGAGLKGGASTTTTSRKPLPITFAAASANFDSYSEVDYDYENIEVEDIEDDDVGNNQCNGTLTLFTKTYNRGEELMIEEDSEDLEGFDNKAVTALVTGDCCWDIFSEQNFAGVRKTLRPGEKYTGANSLGRDLFRNVSSVRRNTARRCR